MVLAHFLFIVENIRFSYYIGSEFYLKEVADACDNNIEAVRQFRLGDSPAAE
jgi:hypothetical protein